MGGRAEAMHRSVRTVNLWHEARCTSCALAARRKQKHDPAAKLRRVVCAACAPKPDDFRVRILPTGGVDFPRLRLRGSATFIETRMASCSRRQHLSLRSRHRKQLLPRRRPTHGSTRQDAECRARRPSRLVQRETDGVTPLAGHSCKIFLRSRQAARRLSARTWMRLAGEPFER